MDNYTIQMKITAIIDIPCDAKSIESALIVGNNIKWKDILAKNISVADGQYEVVGAWDNDCWDLTLPISNGLTIKAKPEGNKIFTMFSLLGRTVAIWKQDLI